MVHGCGQGPAPECEDQRQPSRDRHAPFASSPRRRDGSDDVFRAQAQVYVGGNAGWSRLSVDCTDIASCDKTGTGYKAYVGYRWGSGFAVEGLYIDWGKAKSQVAGEELDLPSTLSNRRCCAARRWKARRAPTRPTST